MANPNLHEQVNLLANENHILREYIYRLEGYVSELTKHQHPQSVYGELKVRLLMKRPHILRQTGKPLG